MTREEAINLLSQMRKDGEGFLSDNTIEAYDMAIKALEQEPILDKIRAEIDRQQKWLLQAGYTTYNVDIALDAIKAVVAGGETKEEPDELIKALKEYFSDDGDGKVEMGAYWEHKAVIEVIRNYFKTEREDANG